MFTHEFWLTSTRNDGFPVCDFSAATKDRKWNHNTKEPAHSPTPRCKRIVTSTLWNERTSWQLNIIATELCTGSYASNRLQRLMCSNKGMTWSDSYAQGLPRISLDQDQANSASSAMTMATRMADSSLSLVQQAFFELTSKWESSDITDKLASVQASTGQIHTPNRAVQWDQRLCVQ